MRREDVDEVTDLEHQESLTVQSARETGVMVTGDVQTRRSERLAEERGRE